ncbi:MAG: MFS transporter [Azospirillaceae bacterium]
MGRSAAFIILRVFIPFMLAYFISELFRTVNAIVGPEIRRDLDLSPEELGFLTSIFLITVASVQVFVGIFLDRHGPRRTVACLLVIGAAGSALFSVGVLEAMLVGRFLIGLGMAGCWTAAFKVNAQWWPLERLALANGAIIGFAGLGALASTLPTQILLEWMTWNEVFLAVALLTLATAVLLWIVAPEHPDDMAGGERQSLFREFKEFGTIMRNPVFLVVGPASIVCQGVWLSNQGLWAGVWLREVNGLSSVVAATFLFVFAASVIVGNLVIGFLTDLAQRKGVSLLSTMVLVTSLFVGVQIVILLNLFGGALALWVAFGLLVAGPIFAYALISRAVAPGLSGRAVSLLNLFATLAGFFIQYGAGAVIELWQPDAAGIYPVAAHQTAFGIVVGVQLLAAAWMLATMGGKVRNSLEYSGASD